MTDVSRRGLIAAAATGAYAMTSPTQVRGASAGTPAPVQGARGAPIIGPRNPAREAQEPIRTGGGSVRITDSSVFPASVTIAAALIDGLPTRKSPVVSG